MDVMRAGAIEWEEVSEYADDDAVGESGEGGGRESDGAAEE
jgi:hypothetical protein